MAGAAIDQDRARAALRHAFAAIRGRVERGLAPLRAPAKRAFGAWDGLFEHPLAIALARSPRLCTLVSGGLHGLVLAWCLINWSHIFHIGQQNAQSIIPVELITVGDETNIAAMVRQQLLYDPSDTQQDAPAPAGASASSQFEMRLFPQKPVETAQGQAAAEAHGTNPNPTAKPSAGPRNVAVGDYNIKAVGDASAMILSLSDALWNQIAQCWHPRAGDGTVSFQLVLAIDGAIERLPRLLEGNGTAGAESVRRAIYTCAPYKLPAGRFREWHEITLTFDPNLLQR